MFKKTIFSTIVIEILVYYRSVRCAKIYELKRIQQKGKNTLDEILNNLKQVI